MKEWTIMVYMAGDNNLSADMAYALADIRDVMKGRSDKISLMVYYDGAAFNAPTLYCDFTDFDNPVFCPSRSVKKAFTYEKKRNGDETEFDENSGAVYSLMNFINWCVNETEINIYKDEQAAIETHSGQQAKKYALIFSGHASAFQNMSLMVDANSDYYMTIPKLRWALEEITRKNAPFKKHTPLLKQEIDILGFDSCVMGMAELAYEFRHAAKIMVASEGNLPSAGWTYGSILSELIVPFAGEAITDEKAVAAGFVEKFIERQNEFLIGGVSVDISALDLSDEKIANVIKQTNLLGKNLSLLLQNLNPKIGEKLKRVLLLSHWECQSYMSEQNVDLKDFCGVLIKNIKALDETCEDINKIVDDCEKVAGAVDDCVLMCGFSGGTYQYSNGIAVFFPWTRLSYFRSQENYENLKALRDDIPLKDWNQFLRDFTDQTLRPARQEMNAGNRLGKIVGNEFYSPSKNNPTANGRYFMTDRNNGIANDKNTHIGNDKNTHIGNDKNTHIGNDKNLLIGSDKNTHIGNDKNTHIGNDKGLQQFLTTQFKNTDSPWNISGFTKNTSQPKKKEKSKKKEKPIVE